MKDNSKLIAFILVIITIVVVIVSLIFNSSQKKVNEPINIVTNYSNFYTVNSCLYRLTTYLNTNDNEKLLLLLNDNYKKNNNIDLNSVRSVFDNIGENNTFISKKMYYQKVNKSVIKYYVYGWFQKNQISDDFIATKKDYIDAYFILYLDTTNKIFSVEPYTQDLFLNLENTGGK